MEFTNYREMSLYYGHLIMAILDMFYFGENQIVLLLKQLQIFKNIEYKKYACINTNTICCLYNCMIARYRNVVWNT